MAAMALEMLILTCVPVRRSARNALGRDRWGDGCMAGARSVG